VQNSLIEIGQSKVPFSPANCPSTINVLESYVRVSQRIAQQRTSYHIRRKLGRQISRYMPDLPALNIVDSDGIAVILEHVSHFVGLTDASYRIRRLPTQEDGLSNARMAIVIPNSDNLVVCPHQLRSNTSVGTSIPIRPIST
jgi:hypothetical protein